MTSIKLIVNGARASATTNGILTSGSVGIPVTIQYDSTWDGLTKNLVCASGKYEPTGNSRTIMGIDTAAVVAHEVMTANNRLYLGVEGRNADGTLVIPTRWADCGPIFPGVDDSADPSADPTLPIWAQLQAELQALKGTNTAENTNGLTATHITALDGMFKVCAFTKADISAEYTAFKTAFGISDSGGNTPNIPEEPDVPDKPDEPEVKAYTVTNNLTNVTNSNTATTASGYYSATLSAEDGYEMSVVITMDGVDITNSVYTADGTILITDVTGDIVITATAELAAAPVLYQLANTPRTVNADLYEDTGLDFGSSTAKGYTKAWTMVAKVKNLSAGALWSVHAEPNFAGQYSKGWNGEANANTVSVAMKICASNVWAGITVDKPSEIRFAITHEAMSEKTVTVYAFSYAGELRATSVVGTYGSFASDVYTGSMMVGGLSGADFIGTIEEFTIYEGVATEDQIKHYLGVA